MIHLKQGVRISQLVFLAMQIYDTSLDYLKIPPEYFC